MNQGEIVPRLTSEPRNSSEVFWDFEKVPRFFVPRFSKSSEVFQKKSRVFKNSSEVFENSSEVLYPV